MTWFSEKCLFPIVYAYLVWHPTWSKNLGRYLIYILYWTLNGTWKNLPFKKNYLLNSIAIEQAIYKGPVYRIHKPTKGGLISESFLLRLKSPKKRCQITIHLKKRCSLFWNLSQWKTFEIKPPLKRNKETFLEDSVLILRCFFASSKETRSLHVTHCYFTQLNSKRISPFKQK